MPNLIGIAGYTYANGGSCYRCSAADRLIDMDTNIAGEGFLALCTGCVEEAARAARLTFSAAAVRDAEARAAAAESRALEAEKLVAEFQAALNGLKRVSRSAK